MNRSITINLDEAVLQRAEQSAAAQNRSLSEWAAQVIEQAAPPVADLAAVRASMEEAFKITADLGGKPLTRDEIYAERLR